MKFLIVEDREKWQEMLRETLEEAGGEVVVVDDVEIADGLLRDPKQIFDHVISDGMEGDWTRVHEAAQEKGVAMTLVSFNTKFGEAATELGIPFIHKKDFDNFAFRERYFPPGGLPKQALR